MSFSTSRTPLSRSAACTKTTGNKARTNTFSGMDAQVLSNIDGYLRRAQELVAVDEADQPLRLLDIGCGNGGLMQRAQLLGICG